MFEIQPMNPEHYRRETRRIALVLVAIFAVLAMAAAALAVQLFGSPDGDNFRYNLAGVLLGLLATVTLVRLKLWSQPWMAPAVYGWRLKRSLMRVTNVMHQVESGVKAGDPAASKLLRFYHLGLMQMHRLDGNSAALGLTAREIDQHLERLEALGIEAEQNRLEPEWLAAVKGIRV